MIGKAYVWKTVTDSALTTELGRSFQRDITSGKKEHLYALVQAKMSELMEMVGAIASMS